VGKSPHCSECKRRILAREGRIVVAGRWVCGDCAYQMEQTSKRLHKRKGIGNG